MVMHMNTFTHKFYFHKKIPFIVALVIVLSFQTIMFAQLELKQPYIQTSSSQISQIFDVLGDFRNNTVFSCVNGFDFARIAQERGGKVHSQTFTDFTTNPSKLLSGSIIFHKMYFINTFHECDNRSALYDLIKKSLKVSGECYFIQKNDSRSKNIIVNSNLTLDNLVNELKEHHFHYITIDTTSIDGYSLIRIDNYSNPCEDH